MSKQLRSWFYTGPANRFKADDKPVQSTFQTLTDSTINILEDFATMTKPGIAVLANAPYPGDNVVVDGVAYPAVPTSGEVDARIQAALGSPLTTDQPLVISQLGLNVDRVNIQPSNANTYIKTENDGVTVGWGSPIGRTDWAAIAVTANNGAGFTLNGASYVEYALVTWVAGTRVGSQFMELRGNLIVSHAATPLVTAIGATMATFTIPNPPSKTLTFPLFIYDSVVDGATLVAKLVVSSGGVCSVIIYPNVGGSIATASLEVPFSVSIPLF